jgi:hypothetical protein
LGERSNNPVKLRCVRDKTAAGIFYLVMTGDSILKGLTHPEDILLQTSPSGSYRCGHVIEFLAFILPVAQTPEDSCMVILDRFAPHMSEEGEQLVAEYGHLYDVLGGGQTMSGQVGDTHRHGPLWPKSAGKKTPTYTSADIRKQLVFIVLVFSNINHCVAYTIIATMKTCTV